MRKIGVIGIGKLGICFALNLERSGYDVIGIDIFKEYVKDINNKTLQSTEPLVEEYLKKSLKLKASTKLNDVIDDDIDLLFVFVATPSLPDGSYDHSQIERISDELITFGRRNHPTHLIVGCTTMPGYCNTLATKMSPYNYTVSYNPEFIAQGNIIHDLQNPDQVLIGEADDEVGLILEQVYSTICKNQPIYCRMDRLSAEITKIATNCFLTTKISFANSIGDLAIKTGANKEKILEAIGSDSRIGRKYLGYGFGFGGPCFPRDNRALGKFARENDYELLISDATDDVNRRHLTFQLEEYLKTYPEGSTIIFNGVSYKKGSTLIEESQQLALAVSLSKKKRNVLIRDQKEVIRQVEKLYPNLFTFEETQ